MAEYLELIKPREEAISRLKTDYSKLIKVAKEWATEKGFDSKKIIWIEAWTAYLSGSLQERIYLNDEKGHSPFNEGDKFLGKNVEINGTDYHLEILISTT